MSSTELEGLQEISRSSKILH